MGERVGNYDPKEISIIVNGHTIEEFADGTFVNVTRDSNSSEDVSGADGFVSRAKQNDKRGNLVLTLNQTSLSNSILTRLLRGYENGDGEGNSPFPIMVKDNLGATVHNASQAQVMKPADAGYSKGIETRAWTIRCYDLEMGDAGTN